MKLSQFSSIKRDLTPNLEGYPPKLLFLARPFPPLRAVGCVRTWNIAKYLSRLGWQVTVVTPRPEVWRNVEDVEIWEKAFMREGIRRILTDHYSRWMLSGSMNGWESLVGKIGGGILRKIHRSLKEDYGNGWIKPVEEACSTLSKGDFDVILATGSPFSSFQIAKGLSEKLGCPYVLDYRDPWTFNPHRVSPASKSIIQKENQFLEKAAKVTIVSNSWKRNLQEQYRLGNKVFTISNGYDPEELSKVRPIRFEHFSISYTGTFYPPKRVITPLMATLKRLKEKTKDGNFQKWYFHYYGPENEHVTKEAEKYKVLDRVVLHGKVPKNDALAALKGSDIAIVITSLASNPSLADKGMVTAKIFEAIGLQTPVLLISPPLSDARRIIEKTNGGKCFSEKQVEEMSQFILSMLLSGPHNNAPATVGKGDEFSWPSLAMRMNHVLLKAINNSRK